MGMPNWTPNGANVNRNLTPSNHTGTTVVLRSDRELLEVALQPGVKWLIFDAPARFRLVRFT